MYYWSTSKRVLKKDRQKDRQTDAQTETMRVPSDSGTLKITNEIS